MLAELFDIVVMAVAVAFIFLPEWSKEGFRLSLLVTAPAVVLHEIAHKFVAIAFGASATIHAQYFGLGLGIFLRAIQSPFILFIPGYAAIQGDVTVLANILISFAGPGINLVLYLMSSYLLGRARDAQRLSRHHVLLVLTKRINGFLFVFNMLPVPPMDGFHVLSGILSLV